MSSSSRFSCSACERSYSWKPELAGKRVKCKCGQALTVPANDPAVAVEEPMGFDALMPSEDAGMGDAPAHPTGPTCPSCNSPVDANAVICINCGQNLKTGKKLKTTKLASNEAAAAATDKLVPGYRSYGAMANDSEGMSKQKKTIIMIACIGGLVAIIGVVLAITIPASKAEKERLANLNSKPTKLEKIIANSEAAGGMTEAMRNGTLMSGIEDDPATLSFKEARARERETTWLEMFCEGRYELKGQELKSFLAADPKNHIRGLDRNQSVSTADEMYKLGLTRIQRSELATDLPEKDMVTSVVATMPTDPAARKKIFAWYQKQKVFNPIDLPYNGEERKQKYMAVQFSD